MEPKGNLSLVLSCKPVSWPSSLFCLPKSVSSRIGYSPCPNSLFHCWVPSVWMFLLLIHLGVNPFPPPSLTFRVCPFLTLLNVLRLIVSPLQRCLLNYFQKFFSFLLRLCRFLETPVDHFRALSSLIFDPCQPHFPALNGVFPSYASPDS